jgi:hypothetical protein
MVTAIANVKVNTRWNFSDVRVCVVMRVVVAYVQSN